MKAFPSNQDSWADARGHFQYPSRCIPLSAGALCVPAVIERETLSASLHPYIQAGYTSVRTKRYCKVLGARASRPRKIVNARNSIGERYRDEVPNAKGQVRQKSFFPIRSLAGVPPALPGLCGWRYKTVPPSYMKQAIAHVNCEE